MSFSEEERQEVAHRAGEFEMYVDDLASRLIEAEANGVSLQNSVHIQSAQIERQQKTIEKQARTINDLIRDNKLMHKTLQANFSNIRETFAQLNGPQHQGTDQRHDGVERLRVVTGG